MPATFAHPAFAWPLRRVGLPWMALVVGSMVPDVAHLLPRRPWTDHTLLSAFTFSLPLGLLIFIVYGRIVAPALPSLVPPAWREALRERLTRRRPWLPSATAILVGALLHIGLDGFTHAHRGPVLALPLLRAELLHIPAYGGVPTYKLLQYGGGLFGTAFLAERALRWALRHRAGRARPSEAWPLGLAFGLTGIGAVWIAHRESYWLEEPDRTQVFLVSGAAGGMVVGSTLALAYALVWWTARALAKNEEREDRQTSQPSPGSTEDGSK